MTTTTPIAGNYTDNAAVAQRLKHAAIDSLHSFRPGTGPLTVAPISGELEVTARFIRHTWGYSAQLWARDERARIQASAEASVIDPTGDNTIRSRIKQFRTGELLWTHIAAPVNQEPIIAGPNAYIAAAGDHVYQLHQEYDTRYRPVWLLTTPGLDLLEERRFAGIPSAVAYIADALRPAQVA
ncbi:MAG: hypothetical protein K2X52_27700 [Mycobacteriaceae bacterium]|nr:hypothetical protein [Mycobacteriaceae bacterium]